MPSKIASSKTKPKPPASTPGAAQTAHTEMPKPTSNNTVPLSKLVRWPDNPRQTTPDHVNTLAASIISMGLLQNLNVRPSAADQNLFEVVAGGSRLAALEQLRDAGKIPHDYPVPVDIRPLTDTQATTLALTENVVRSQMQPMAEYEAFATLHKDGLAIGEIAEIFGISLKTVERRLALASLVPEAKELVANNSRDLQWAGVMTAVDPATQTRICTDIAKDANSWRTHTDVKRFVDTTGIPSRHALFDLALYTGPVSRNLFDDADASTLLDTDQFWRLQNDAIAKLEETLRYNHANVVVLRSQFDRWRYQTNTDPLSNTAIIEVQPTGAVVTHDNLSLIVVNSGTNDTDPNINDEATETTSNAGANTAPNGTNSTATSASQLPTTTALTHHLRDPLTDLSPPACNYANLHRTAALQVAIAKDTKLAKAILIAGFAGHPDVHFKVAPWTPHGAPDARKSPAFKELEHVRKGAENLAERLDASTDAEKREKLVSVLVAMDNETLDALLAAAVAIRISPSKTNQADTDPTSLFNAIAIHAKIKMRDHWTPDEAYLSHLTAQELRVMANNMIPNQTTNNYDDVSKATLVKSLATYFEKASANDDSLPAHVAKTFNEWTPAAFNFPMGVAHTEDEALQIFDTAVAA